METNMKKTRITNGFMAGLISAGVAGLMILGNALEEQGKDDSGKKAAPVVVEHEEVNKDVATSEERLMAFNAAKEAVIEGLVSPETADFRNFIAAVENDVYYLGKGVFAVDSYVESENGYGVKVRTKFYCVLKHEGEDWNVESLIFQE